MVANKVVMEQDAQRLQQAQEHNVGKYIIVRSSFPTSRAINYFISCCEDMGVMSTGQNSFVELSISRFGYRGVPVAVTGK